MVVSPIAAVGEVIRNIATISSNETTVVISNQLLIPVTQAPTPIMSILKTDTTAIARPGNVLSYTIELQNKGKMPISNIVLRDPLPTGAIFLNADGGGTEQGGIVRWAIAALDVDSTTTLHLNVTIDKTYSDPTITNTAYVTADGVPESSSTAVKTLSTRTPGKVAFFDADWQAAYGYMSGAMIFMQVSDTDQNMDPVIAETLTVVLTDPSTSDTETVILTETGPDTGIFRGNIPSTLTSTTNGNGVLTVAADSRIQVTYTDPLDAQPVSQALALIDPLGVVFDSITGNTVAGVVVTLRNWNPLTSTCDLTSWPSLPPGQINPAPITGENGRFAFPLAPPGDYCFQVAPPASYTYPSMVADLDLPPGFTIGKGSRGENFTLSVGDPALICDIPLDPPAGPLTVAKTANKTTAAIGDMVGYSLKITNSGAAPLTNITLTDVMPHGVQYIPGSSRLGGAAIADPRVTGTRTLAWTIVTLDPSTAAEITYRAVVGPDSLRGDGINTIMAAGHSLGRMITSNKASVKIKITGGIFTDKGTIIGKVFLDRDGNRIQNQSDRAKTGKPDEPGIPNVALYLEDGTRVITDPGGKYSITGVSPGTHVLRVDETSLPKNVILVPLSNRFLGDGASQFVDMTAGGLFQADFAVEQQGPEPVVKEERKDRSTCTSKAGKR